MQRKKPAFITKHFRYLLTCTSLLQFLLFSQCKKKENDLPAPSAAIPTNDDPASPGAPGSTGDPAQTTPTFVYNIKTTETIVDGSELNIPAGALITIEPGNRGPLLLKNMEGTKSAPIIIMNGNGKTNIQSSGSYGFKTENCRNFKVTGTGGGGEYGITVDGGNIGMTFDYLSSDFSVDHVEVKNCGFAGIMAKTDPGCDQATWRGNFLMENLKFHDNYVHDVKGEGFYIGNSFHEGGRDLDCGKILPHEIVNVEIFNNKVRNSGCEGIQAGCVTSGLEIYNNTIENYGTSPFAAAQDNGVQIGEGSFDVKMYNNIIKNGPGCGIIILGRGNTSIYNNLVVNAGSYGAFVDNRGMASGDISFIHNTFIDPKLGGIKNYNELVSNKYYNNIITGSSEPFIYSEGATGVEEHNLTGESSAACGFVNPASGNYRLNTESPAINQGKITVVQKDMENNPRPMGDAPDLGAYEFVH